MSLIKLLTLQGAGIGILSEPTVRTEKKNGDIVQILSNLVLPKVPVYLLFPQKQMPKRIADLYVLPCITSGNQFYYLLA